MKAKNHFVQFKNENIEADKLKDKSTDYIIADRMDTVLNSKFHTLVEMYKGDVYANGYNPGLAFRVIWLFLYCELKQQQFNLVEQVTRYLDHQLRSQDLSCIQKCMDLILTKPLSLQVPDKFYNLWKIRIFRSLKKYYSINHIKHEKKRISYTMRQLCKQELKKESVKHDAQIYEKIMDILLEQERIIMNSKKAHHKLFEAIENGNNIIRVLEKSEKNIIPKYQEQLMMAYWDIAKIHHQLHYVTYTKKYSETALNIAQRINDHKIAQAAHNLLESLSEAS